VICCDYQLAFDLGELFSNIFSITFLLGRMRNFLGAIVSSFNLLMILLVLKFFPNLHMAIGFHGLFWIYAAVSLFGGIFSFIFIPETKGKTLNEIESFFSKKHFLTSEDLS